MKKGEKDDIRKKVDRILRRLERDAKFRVQMNARPEDTLIAAGLGPEAAVILAEDWRGLARRPQGNSCPVNNSCRFTDSVDPCGRTATSLRTCPPK